MQNSKISKALLISLLIAASIVLNDARPGASQIIRMPSSELDRYNTPTGSDVNGNPTYNGCGGVSNCFPTGGPSPSPTPTASPSPAPSPGDCIGTWSVSVTPPGTPNVYTVSGRASDTFSLFNSRVISPTTGEEMSGIEQNSVISGRSVVKSPYASPSIGINLNPTFSPGAACSPSGDGSGGGSGSPGSGGDGPSPSPSPTGDGTGGTGGTGGTPKNGEDDKGYRSTKPNFIAYGMTVFSKRFPFDVFGTAPAGGADDVCPRLDILGKQFEMCIILDALKMLKIPTIIAFIVWSVQSL